MIGKLSSCNKEGLKKLPFIVSYISGGYSSSTPLPDISKWTIENVIDRTEMFNGNYTLL